MEFDKEFYRVVFVLCMLCLLAISAYRAWRSWHPKKPQPKGEITVNEQGMVRINVAALRATPLTGQEVQGSVFPHELDGFLAELSPREVHTILLESATGTYSEVKRDIARVVTIAAGWYDFKIPLRLVCLDARTHALFNALMRDMEMKSIRVCDETHPNCDEAPYLVLRKDAPEPEEHYVLNMNLIGHLLLHYSMKNSYPSFRNFVATFQRNLMDRTRKYTHHDITSMLTGYAAITGMPLPKSYISYSTLAEQLLNSKARDKVKFSKLRLVKS